MAVHPRGPSPLAHQQVPRPSIQTTSYLPRRTDRPNLRQPRPTAPPAFVAISRHANQSSGSRGQPSKRKIDRDNLRWDPIPITYAELLPKLIDDGSIVPIQGKPRKPPFPKWYDVNTRCDYHSRVPGHSVENYSALKRKVRSLIRKEKLKFEKSDGPSEVECPYGTKAKMTRQEKEAPREAVFKKAAMPKEKVPITKIGRSEASYSLTTEGSKERSCEPNERQEKNTFQGSTQGLERMSVKRNECEEHNSRTSKRRRILRGNEA